MKNHQSRPKERNIRNPCHNNSPNLSTSHPNSGLKGTNQKSEICILLSLDRKIERLLPDREIPSFTVVEATRGEDPCIRKVNHR